MKYRWQHHKASTTWDLNTATELPQGQEDESEKTSHRRYSENDTNGN